MPIRKRDFQWAVDSVDRIDSQTVKVRPFVKMQAVGNDFVLVDVHGEEEDWPDKDEVDWPAFARRVCDRKFGIGGDGLLIVDEDMTKKHRYLYTASMKMYNPDGTRDMCGNGLRCVIKFIHLYSAIHGPYSKLGSSVICTDYGLYPYSINEDGGITTQMLPPRFAPEQVPVLADAPLTVTDERGKTLRLSGAVNTGSTHAVVFVPELPDDETFFHWSPLVENAPLFPERTSLMWAKVEGSATLRLRIWERGAGETLGCGTGACAAAVVARTTGRVSAGTIAVCSTGGTLFSRWNGDPDSPVFLTGPAEAVYEGFIVAEG